MSLSTREAIECFLAIAFAGRLPPDRDATLAGRAARHAPDARSGNDWGVNRDAAHPDELRGFDEAATRAVALAAREARELGHDRVGTEHVLLGLLTNHSETSTTLTDAGVTLAAARTKVIEAVGTFTARPPTSADPSEGRRGPSARSVEHPASLMPTAHMSSPVTTCCAVCSMSRARPVRSCGASEWTLMHSASLDAHESSHATRTAS